MNVEELIEELTKYPNKNVEVYIYYNDTIHDIQMVDLSIDDRVDINVDEEKGIASVIDGVRV